MKHLLKHKLIGCALILTGLSLAMLGITSMQVNAATTLPAGMRTFAAEANPCAGQPGTHPVEGVANKGSVTCCPGKANSAQECLYAKYINPLINLLSALVGLTVVIGIIIGGIQFSSSAGDPQQAAKGKAHIRNALIALFAYLFLWTALQFLVPGGRLNG